MTENCASVGLQQHSKIIFTALLLN